MHGSAARGIAIPFAPSSLLPCPPPRFRSLARLLSNSPRFLPPLSTLFSCHPSHSVGSAGIYPRVFAFFSLSPSFSHPSLSLSFFVFPLLCISVVHLYRLRRKPADTRTHAEKVGRTASRKLNSRQRVRRACSQLCGASGTKLNDRGVFRLLRR